eukprot:8124177-Pyramimonas_sp.AAC.1
MDRGSHGRMGGRRTCPVRAGGAEVCEGPAKWRLDQGAANLAAPEAANGTRVDDRGDRLRGHLVGEVKTGRVIQVSMEQQRNPAP